ncbi:hypothetical protein FA13DRAFT_1791298 [Coprinellus micaceus]|uniref:Uncharacterized protein n=1 Tax=Coprinellus micaceus TaxID=71717 RepID=A0A4Y7TBE2_COPMI|nr:hypothetical protein FA13DRAFT_1791298 [Coprinellus micaceus]
MFVQVETLGFLHSLFSKLQTAKGRGFSSIQELQLRGYSRYGTSLLRLKGAPENSSLVHLELGFQGPPLNTHELLRAVEKAFDFSSLSILEVDHESELSTEVWTSIFSPLKMLKSISLVATTPVNVFFDALDAANASGGFSGLANITLREINFKKQRPNICDALVSRPRSAPLITLSIEKARQFGEIRRREMIDNAPSVEVIWDGSDSSDDFSGGSGDENVDLSTGVLELDTSSEDSSTDISEEGSENLLVAGSAEDDGDLSTSGSSDDE